MNNKIKCPKCGEEFEITEALRSEIEAQVIKVERTKYEENLKSAVVEAEKRTSEKIARDYELKISKAEEDSSAEKDRNKKLIEELKEAQAKAREEKFAKEKIEFELNKKFAEKEDQIIYETKKSADEEHRIKDLEKDKQNSDLKKQIEELKRRVERGDQQNQGESFELELENILKSEFPSDNIRPVPKGIRGADVIQDVCDKYGNICGSILWESKNAKWSEGWISKLKDDQRATKSQIAVLITTMPPDEVETFKFKNGVWVTNTKCSIPLAHSLRINIGQIFHAKKTNEGKNEKMEILFNYLTSVDFQQRVEAIVETFGEMQLDIEKEKRWFNSKWAKEEKSIRKIIDNTYGMYGDLQGIIGAEGLPQLESLKMLDEGAEIEGISNDK